MVFQTLSHNIVSSTPCHAQVITIIFQKM